MPLKPTQEPSGDLGQWLVPLETNQDQNSEQTVQYEVVSNSSDFIWSGCKQTYRTTLYVNINSSPVSMGQTPTTSTTGLGFNSGTCGSTNQPDNEEIHLGAESVHWDLKPWLIPLEKGSGLSYDFYGSKTMQDSKCENELAGSGSECSGTADSCGDSVMTSVDYLSRWLAEIKSMESMEGRSNDSGNTLDYSKWLIHKKQTVFSVESPTHCDGLNMDSIGFDSHKLCWVRQEVFDVDEGSNPSLLGAPISQSTPWMHRPSGGNVEGTPVFSHSTPWNNQAVCSETNVQSPYQHVTALEREIKILEKKLSIRDAEIESLNKMNETVHIELERSEQKVADLKEELSQTIDTANNEVKIAQNYIDSQRFLLEEKDQKISDLEISGAMQCLEDKSKAQDKLVQDQPLCKGETASMEMTAENEHDHGENKLLNTTEQVVTSENQKSAINDLSLCQTKSDTDSVQEPHGVVPGLAASPNNEGKPAVKKKHYSFSARLDQTNQGKKYEVSSHWSIAKQLGIEDSLPLFLRNESDLTDEVQETPSMK